MVAPRSRGLSFGAPLMNRQGMASPQRPMSNFGIAPTGSLRALPGQPRPGFAPQSMVQPKQAMPMYQSQQAMPMAAPNPFAGYTQPVQKQSLGFNLNPTPTAGMGAGQMPMVKQMTPQIAPQMLPQVEPYDPYQVQQPMPMPMAQPGNPGLDPNIMFGTPSNAQGQNFTRPVGQPNPALNPDIMFAPVPQQTPVNQLGNPSLNPDIMFAPPIEPNSPSLFNPRSLKTK